LKTGTWPDKTILVTENRFGSSKGSINKNGKFQTDFRGLEIHVKDEAHLPRKWAFYFSDGKQPSPRRPDNAQCYTCHEGHGAVDTTFVQFYPTLLDIAKAKGTLSASYLKEEEVTAAPSVPAPR
jgi:hypothetical protein